MTWILHKLFSEMDEIDAMEKLQKHMRDTKNNNEFFAAMTGGDRPSVGKVRAGALAPDV